MVAHGKLRRGPRTALALGLFGATVLVIPVAASAATDAEVQDVGDVAVVEADDLLEELQSGEIDTAFTLRLPEGASCPGDSANDQWKVQSFIVPSADDPSTLVFDGVIKPSEDDQWSLFGVDTVPFIGANTAENPEPGRPGLIVGIPPFDFQVFTPEMLPAGTYRLGIACTYFAEPPARYWDTEIVVTRSAESPDELTWRLAGVPESALEQDAEASRLPWIVGGVLALGVIAAAVWWAAKRTSRSSLKETT